MIDAIESALELPVGTLDLERDVLNDYGNMSAPTVLFVLERLIARGLPRTGADDRVRSGLHLRRTAARAPLMWPAIALLAFVTLQRLVELPLAQANTRRLIAKAAMRSGRAIIRSSSRSTPPGSLTLWWLAPGRPIHLPFLALFVADRGGPGLGPAHARRPLDDADHRRSRRNAGRQRPVSLRQIIPIIWSSIGEIAVLPLVFGLWDVAMSFRCSTRRF